MCRRVLHGSKKFREGKISKVRRKKLRKVNHLYSKVAKYWDVL